MRLIDADMLMKEYQVKLCCNTDCINCTLFQGDGEVCLFERFVKDAPTIDAVPVIRCKDCVHYKGHWYCDAWNNSPGFPAVTEDGFCNMAERRTDETD